MQHTLERKEQRIEDPYDPDVHYQTDQQFKGKNKKTQKYKD